MPAKGRVDVNIQTLFCLVPVLDMVAAYRVRRLRMYLLVMIGVAAVVSVIDYALYPQNWDPAVDHEFAPFYYGTGYEYMVFFAAS